MNESELSEACDFAQDLARKCGAMIRKAFKEPKTVETKSSAVDLVTETDEAVEKGNGSYFFDFNKFGYASLRTGNSI